MRTFRNRTDTNQSDIVSTLRAVGADWISTSGDPGIGFDGIVLFRGRIFIAEVKDETKPPSARRLTENEEKRKAQCEAHGVPYLIFLNPDQALEAIGAKKVNGQAGNRDIVKSAEQRMKDAARTLKSVVANLEEDAA